MKWLKKWAELQPEKKYLNDVNFGEMLVQVQERAGQLAGLVDGIKRVALLSENSIEMAVMLFALMGLGKEVLLLNTHLTADELYDQLTEPSVTVFFVSDGLVDKLPGGISFSAVLTEPSVNVVLTDDFADEKITVLMNTSATTGKFKTVPISWGMITNHVKASAATIGILPDDNWLVVLPMFHVSGLSIIMRSLYNGTRSTILPKFDEEQILELVNTGIINMMSLVPTMLNRIIDRLERHQLRMILLGGEFIPQPLMLKAQAKNLPIYKTYGMTESFSQSVTFNILEFPEKFSSVGRPLPGVEIEIRQPDKDGAGEIWLRSPMLMKNYLRKAPYGKVFETGDIGYLDADGFLYVLNRRKDIIISGGENIYPKELEDLLYSHPKIRECAVIPRTHDTWGQVPVLYVASTLTAQEIHDFMAKKLAKYKLPHEILFMDTLPKNASGKILRKDLK